MDLTQTDHLKAYGITYRALEKGYLADWLLNYRGGSFAIDFSDEMVLDCRLQGVSFELLDAAATVDIYSFVQQEDQNMDVVRLEKAPKVAVYVPRASTHGTTLLHSLLNTQGSRTISSGMKKFFGETSQNTTGYTSITKISPGSTENFMPRMLTHHGTSKIKKDMRTMHTAWATPKSRK